MAGGECGVLEGYQAAVGKPKAEVVTPALLLDVKAARQNIRRMADRLTGPARLHRGG